MKLVRRRCREFLIIVWPPFGRIDPQIAQMTQMETVFDKSLRKSTGYPASLPENLRLSAQSADKASFKLNYHSIYPNNTHD
ncbi:MAG: hypothetical protein WCO94_17620 [Verrucomicrobiota bacterium]